MTRSQTDSRNFYLYHRVLDKLTVEYIDNTRSCPDDAGHKIAKLLLIN